MESDLDSNWFMFVNQKIGFYCPIIIMIIGTIGCFCNFITLTSFKLRKTSCSLYFLGAAIFDLFTLDFGTLTRFLSDHFGYDLYNQSQIYCKIRQYLVNVLPAIATCFIVLAVMDRFMSTSSKQSYRSFATIKRAKWIIILSIIICILSYIHYPIFSDLNPMCTLQPGVYSVFIVVFSILWTSFIPHFLMLCFGFGIYWHIHTMHRRVLPINSRQKRIQRVETHFVIMMLFQVGISSLLILTRIAYFSYNIITTNEQKTTYQKALDTLFSQITTQLFYLNYAKSFYVYTLSTFYPLPTYRQNSILCQIIGYMYSVTCCGISWSHAILAINRLCYSIFPQHRWLLTYAFAWYLIAIHWILTFILPLPLIFFNAYQYQHASRLCILTTRQTTTAVTGAILFYNIPFTSVIIVYIIIWCHARRTHNTKVSRSTRDFAIMRHILTLVIIDIICGHPYIVLILLDYLDIAIKEFYLFVTVFITLSVTANMCAIFIFNRKLRKRLCSKQFFWRKALLNISKTSSPIIPMRTSTYSVINNKMPIGTTRTPTKYEMDTIDE